MRATIAIVLLCAGCSHVSNGAATAFAFTAVAAAVQVLASPSLEGRAEVCAEYRELRCASAPSCSRDERLGCDVCRCPALFRGSVIVAPRSYGAGEFVLDVSPPPPWVPPPR